MKSSNAAVLWDKLEKGLFTTSADFERGLSERRGSWNRSSLKAFE